MEGGAWETGKWRWRAQSGSLLVRVNRAEVAITKNQIYIEYFTNQMHLRCLSHTDRKVMWEGFATLLVCSNAFTMTMDVILESSLPPNVLA